MPCWHMHQGGVQHIVTRQLHVLHPMSQKELISVVSVLIVRRLWLKQKSGEISRRHWLIATVSQIQTIHKKYQQYAKQRKEMAYLWNYDGLKFEVRVTLHAGEWWQLSDIQMPSLLSKNTCHNGNSSICKCHCGLKNLKEIVALKSQSADAVQGKLECKWKPGSTFARRNPKLWAKHLYPRVAVVQEWNKPQFSVRDLTLCHRPFLQNAWGVLGPKDQAKKRSELHPFVWQFPDYVKAVARQPFTPQFVNKFLFTDCKPSTSNRHDPTSVEFSG